jgi:hypothetical protein
MARDGPQGGGNRGAMRTKPGTPMGGVVSWGAVVDITNGTPRHRLRLRAEARRPTAEPGDRGTGGGRVIRAERCFAVTDNLPACDGAVGSKIVAAL